MSNSVIDMNAEVPTIFNEDDNEFLFMCYLNLKEQEKAIQGKIKKIQEKFESNDMNGFVHENQQLIKQERNTISLKDDIKTLLKEKGIFEACVSPDKSKINAMIKAKILADEDIKPYEETKTSYAWIVKDIKEVD